MPQDISIKITDRKGELHHLNVPTDMALNLMQVVRAYEIEPVGTVGLCGGIAMCYSCQCYITNTIVLPQKQDEELNTLSKLPNVQPNSRLSCQIPITNELDGLEIQMASLY